MSFVSARSDDGPVVLVQYRPAYTYRYGTTDEYQTQIDACVIVQVGDYGTVYLSIKDAQVLLAALPGILDRHQEVETESDSPRMVA